MVQLVVHSEVSIITTSLPLKEQKTSLDSSSEEKILLLISLMMMRTISSLLALAEVTVEIKVVVVKINREDNKTIHSVVSVALVEVSEVLETSAAWAWEAWEWEAWEWEASVEWVALMMICSTQASETWEEDFSNPLVPSQVEAQAQLQ